MKVAQINCASYGSTGNIAKEIHRALTERGDESYIFYGVGTSDDKNIRPIGSSAHVHLHAILSRYFGMQGYFSRIPTLSLIRKLKKIKPDVIHLHNLHGSYLNLPMLFRYLKRCPSRTVITLHDCWLFTGKCPHFTEVGCYRWKENCGSCPQLLVYPKSLYFDRTNKGLRDKKRWLSGFRDLHVVTVSNWLRDTARQSFLSEYPIDTVYNGIDESVFYPRDGHDVREKYRLSDKFVILGVSSVWNESKGLGDFMKLSEMISEDEVIVLVGLTSSQIAELPKNVIGIARTESKEELARIYSAADVFVSTSLEETFGMVTAEAMACGTPVIVYRSTACDEIVAKDCGYVAEPSDIGTILKYIKAEKSEPLKGSFERVYSRQSMTEGYLNIYDDA